MGEAGVRGAAGNQGPGGDTCSIDTCPSRCSGLWGPARPRRRRRRRGKASREAGGHRPSVAQSCGRWEGLQGLGAQAALVLGGCGWEPRPRGFPLSLQSFPGLPPAPWTSLKQVFIRRANLSARVLFRTRVLDGGPEMAPFAPEKAGPESQAGQGKFGPLTLSFPPFF